MEQEMERRGNIATGESDEDQKWVYDSSVDYKGKVPLRASTGVWKASLFIITIEFSERLSYFGIATNLITYLTKIIHQDLNTAAKNVNYWSGFTTIVPLVGGFLADSYTGRFVMVLFSSLVYLMGLSLLAMSQYIPSLKPCKNTTTEMCNRPRKIHEVVFFFALYMISVGTGGYKPCLESFGADQFDDDHPEERRKKMSFFNWWNFALCCGLFLGVTVIVYVQDYVSWGIADLILLITMAITIVIFYMGRSVFRYRVPQGSPLTPMVQVLVAAIRKRNLPSPLDPSLLYEVPKSENIQGRLLCHSDRLRFLDKAAIVVEEKDHHHHNSTINDQHKQNNPWRLATVTRVEELKLILNTIPIWLTSLAFGITIAQPSTFFVKQAATMNLKLNDFKIPPASLASLGAIAMIISVTLYDRVLVPFLRKTTGNERGLSILRRIGIGLIFSVVAMLVAALVERKRLGVYDKETMSVFWLAPQTIILGFGDGFTLVGLQEYFYDQVPDSMRSLGIALYLSIIGVGSYLSSFLIIVVDHVTEKSSGKSWIGKDMSSSRLDKFYWLLTAMNGLNLCVYMIVTRGYTYKNVDRDNVNTLVDGGSNIGNGVEQV
ncbi:Proton-dependent oligopeptide transporter [Parasponia andersonii]|uniref:Proton-dependent oligopeptide transporter n=1 Tax=Parasponia andersonii TaxID=3476 RepID=A0A2P5BM52_PARAD|nr:Proton-dependent oligopeptide transporter [Parasponia andersonii]